MDVQRTQGPRRICTYRGLHAEYDSLRDEMRAAKKLGARFDVGERQGLLDRIEDWRMRLSAYITDFDSEQAIEMRRTFAESFQRFDDATGPAARVAAAAAKQAERQAALAEAQRQAEADRKQAEREAAEQAAVVAQRLAEAEAAKKAQDEAQRRAAAEKAETEARVRQLEREIAEAERAREALEAKATAEAEAAARALMAAEAATVAAEAKAAAEATAAAEAKAAAEAAKARAAAEAKAAAEAARAEAARAEAARAEAARAEAAAAHQSQPQQKQQHQQSQLAAAAGASSSGPGVLTTEQRARIEINRAAAEERRQVGAKAKRPPTDKGATGLVSASHTSLASSIGSAVSHGRAGGNTDAVAATAANADAAADANANADAHAAAAPSAFSQVMHEACLYDDEDERAKRQRHRQTQVRDFAIKVEETLLKHLGFPLSSRLTMGQLVSKLEAEPYGLGRHKPQLDGALRDLLRWRNISSHPTDAELPSDTAMTHAMSIIMQQLLNSEDFLDKGSDRSVTVPPPIRPALAPPPPHTPPLHAPPLHAPHLHAPPSHPPPLHPPPPRPPPPRPLYALPPPAPLPQSGPPRDAPSRHDGYTQGRGVPPVLPKAHARTSAPQHHQARRW